MILHTRRTTVRNILALALKTVPALPQDKITRSHPTPSPEFIIVHDGPPSDSSAKNYYVKYKDYIKNVASSEIYATWPEATIYANILAIQSITLNRVYTEWSYSIHWFCITRSLYSVIPWINFKLYTDFIIS